MNSLIPKPQNTDLSEISDESEVSILTSAQYQQLSDVPPAIEWFANIDNLQTRRAYENDLRGFMKFVGIDQPEDFRTVTRAMCWPGAKPWRKNRWRAPPFAENSRPWLPCSSTYVKPMR